MSTSDKLPAYVTQILTNRLQLAGTTLQVKQELASSPWAGHTYRDDKLRLWVDFTPSDQLLTNPALVDLLDALRDWGVHFLEHPEEAMCPAEWMRALKAKGLIGGGFKSVYLVDQQWSVFDH